MVVRKYRDLSCFRDNDQLRDRAQDLVFESGKFLDEKGNTEPDVTSY